MTGSPPLSDPPPAPARKKSNVVPLLALGTVITAGALLGARLLNPQASPDLTVQSAATGTPSAGTSPARSALVTPPRAASVNAPATPGLTDAPGERPRGPDAFSHDAPSGGGGGLSAPRTATPAPTSRPPAIPTPPQPVQAAPLATTPAPVSAPVILRPAAPPLALPVPPAPVAVPPAAAAVIPPAPVTPPPAAPVSAAPATVTLTPVNAPLPRPPQGVTPPPPVAFLGVAEGAQRAALLDAGLGPVALTVGEAVPGTPYTVKRISAHQALLSQPDGPDLTLRLPAP